MFGRSSDQKKIGSAPGPDQDWTGPVFSKPKIRSDQSKPTCHTRTIQDGGIDLQTKERIKKIKISAKTDPDQRSGPDRTGFDPRSDRSQEHSKIHGESGMIIIPPRGIFTYVFRIFSEIFG